MQIISVVVGLIAGSIEWAKGNPATITNIRSIQNAM